MRAKCAYWSGIAIEDSHDTDILHVSILNYGVKDNLSVYSSNCQVISFETRDGKMAPVRQRLTGLRDIGSA